MSADPTSRSLWLDAGLLIAAGCLVLLPGIGARDVWNPDEPRYAEVAREMVETGNYLVPQLNHRLYDQKPPLFFWAVAAVGTLRGEVDAVAVRLPSVLAATGLATLAKGPVGLLPPLLAILVFLWLRRDGAEFRRLRPLSGLGIWLAVVAAWLVPAGLQAGGEYLRTMTLTQNLTRYAAPAGFDGTSGHLNPWWHYLFTVANGLAPWTALLPAAAFTAAMPLWVRAHPEHEHLAGLLFRPALALALLLTGWAAFSHGLVWARRPLAAIITLAAGFAVTAAAITRLVLPGVDAVKSTRPFVDAVRSRIDAEAIVAWAPVVQPSILYYLERPGGPELAGSALADWVEQAAEA